MYKPLLAIAIGSIAGGLLRWFFGLKLNALFPTMPLGTLAANLIAAYVIGATAAFLATSPSLAPEWRLLIMTGFCGGLSTFSTFSLELVYLLQRGQPGWALGEIAIHVGGSVAMTLAGVASVQLLRPH
jgi:fluoride exporter